MRDWRMYWDGSMRGSIGMKGGEMSIVLDFPRIEIACSEGV